jgi:hypothetical protein
VPGGGGDRNTDRGQLRHDMLADNARPRSGRSSERVFRHYRWIWISIAIVAISSLQRKRSLSLSEKSRNGPALRMQRKNQAEVAMPSLLTGRALKRELANAGFARTFRTRYKGWIAVVTITLMVSAVLVSASAFPRAFTVPGLTQAAVGAVIGLGALYLGFQQWSAARRELSLDKFYERLAATNRKLDEYRGARDFAGPWRDKHEEDEDLAYERKMYVYLELDNLEYAIAKYNLGYMSSSDAYRSLRTFRQRCDASPEFCKLALNCVSTNLGYNAQTKQAVKSSVKETGGVGI